MVWVRGPSSSTGRIARARINGQPEDLCGAAQPGAQFVQLQMREVQGAQAALIEGLSVRALAREPGGDGGLPVAENPFSHGRVQSFGQCRQYDCDPAREGVFRRYKGV